MATTTTETIRGYIQQLCAQIGTTEQAIYNAQTKAWYFTRGSVSVEVFLSTHDAGNNQMRTFLRAFAPIFVLPTDPQQQLDLYQGALEANAQYMGVKISTIASKGYMYAVTERDIEGMDYNEFNITISDLGYWADRLDDFLKERFGSAQAAAKLP